MTIIFGIFKFFATCVYAFFLLGAMVDIKDDFFEDGENKSPYPKLDVLYFIYTFSNLVFLIKIFQGMKL